RVFAAGVIRFYGHTLEPPILVTAGLLFPGASDDHCRNFCTIFGGGGIPLPRNLRFLCSLFCCAVPDF
ncbi:TPA: hypothetical protein ACWK97_003708, partial [Escherichia coli]